MSSIFLNLDPKYFKVIEALWYAYGRDNCLSYKHLEEDTGLERKELEKIIKVLKAWNYVKAYKGLMTEDGEVAGSGFGVNPEKRDEIELGVEWRGNNSPDYPIEFTLMNRRYRLVEEQTNEYN